MRPRGNFNSRAPVDGPLMNDATRGEYPRMSRRRKDERVIIIAPVGQDAEAMAALLEAKGFETQICHGFDEYSRQITDSAGALLLTEEALESAQSSLFFDVIKTQPPWSELPLIILTSGGESRRAKLLNLATAAAGTVTLLERPISTLTLIRSVEVALRSRRRQYYVRDLVAELAKLNETLEHRVRDRTRELRTANKGLRREIERRRGLEGQILEISDREQQRIGQELHDGFCQHLTAVAFMIRVVAMRLKNHRVIEVEDLEKIAELVNEAAVDARNMARSLHRLEIDSASLLPALRDLVSRETWRTPCRLEVKAKVTLYDDVVASHIYRLLREAVINAQKHAQAKEIVVEIRQSNRETVFRVTDDGVGISAGEGNSDGLGFQIMKDRARTIGARLKVESRKNSGTRVSCYLPNRTTGLHSHAENKMIIHGDSRELREGASR